MIRFPPSRSSRAALLAAALVTGFVLPAAPLGAQVAGRHAVGGPGIVTFEAALGVLSLDRGDERSPHAGVALRAMLHPFAGTPETGPWWTRSQFGAFVAFTPEREGIETLHYGGEIDVHFVPVPRVARFDPFVSLGVGGFRVDATPDAPAASTTHLALSPGLGTHLVLTPRFALRGDVRDVIVFGDETTHNPQLAAGLVLVFALPDWARGGER